MGGGLTQWPSAAAPGHPGARVAGGGPPAVGRLLLADGILATGTLAAPPSSSPQSRPSPMMSHHWAGLLGIGDSRPVTSRRRTIGVPCPLGALTMALITKLSQNFFWGCQTSEAGKARWETGPGWSPKDTRPLTCSVSLDKSLTLFGPLPLCPNVKWRIPGKRFSTALSGGIPSGA